MFLENFLIIWVLHIIIPYTISKQKIDKAHCHIISLLKHFFKLLLLLKKKKYFITNLKKKEKKKHFIIYKYFYCFQLIKEEKKLLYLLLEVILAIKKKSTESGLFTTNFENILEDLNSVWSGVLWSVLTQIPNHNKHSCLDQNFNPTSTD